MFVFDEFEWKKCIFQGILKLKFTCSRSGPRRIYFLDGENKYADIFNYNSDEINSFTLEIRQNVVSLVFIFFDHNREFITLPKAK